MYRRESLSHRSAAPLDEKDSVVHSLDESHGNLLLRFTIDVAAPVPVAPRDKLSLSLPTHSFRRQLFVFAHKRLPLYQQQLKCVKSFLVAFNFVQPKTNHTYVGGRIALVTRCSLPRSLFEYLAVRSRRLKFQRLAGCPG